MEPWYWLNENSRGFLARGYLDKNQTAEERVRVIGEAAGKFLKRPDFADKFVDYMSKGWISPSSPVWSNFGNNKGLPISCFGSYVADNMGSILYTNAEVGMMSKFGGGCSGYFGELRSRGDAISGNGHSSGSVHFMQLFETLVDVVSQGSVRRGHFSPYLPIEHNDVMEFLDIGTEGNPIQKLTHGVTVTDEWMESMIGGDEEKRAIWARVIQRRGEMGYPYIMFKDTANKNTVDVYKDKNLTIHASNMCSEIMLPSHQDNLPFESDEAAKLNIEIFKLIKEKADVATKQLAKELGEPEILRGYGRRNTTTLAIAPTTSSAFILGQVSQGIEPIWSNCYTKDVAKMKVTIKNQSLQKLLAEKGKDNKVTWDSIRDSDGSVQHLDFLTAEEKAIYRTFAEIDQEKVIEQAADRQKFIDQGQSLNVMILPGTPVKDINALYIKAWKLGVKSLYYSHSANAAQAMVRKKLLDNSGAGK
jgi:ribonucleotide reductase alpha subunit